MAWAAEGMDRAAMYAVLWCCLAYLMSAMSQMAASRALRPQTVAWGQARTMKSHGKFQRCKSGKVLPTSLVAVLRRQPRDYLTILQLDFASIDGKVSLCS